MTTHNTGIVYFSFTILAQPIPVHNILSHPHTETHIYMCVLNLRLHMIIHVFVFFLFSSSLSPHQLSIFFVFYLSHFFLFPSPILLLSRNTKYLFFFFLLFPNISLMLISPPFLYSCTTRPPRKQLQNNNVHCDLFSNILHVVCTINEFTSKKNG